MQIPFTFISHRGKYSNHLHGKQARDCVVLWPYASLGAIRTYDDDDCKCLVIFAVPV